MGYHVIRSEDLEWVTRPAEPGEAKRHVAGLTERAGLRHETVEELLVFVYGAPPGLERGEVLDSAV